MIKCDLSACYLGPYCWLDPVGKKHYRLHTQPLRRLVTYAEKGGVLDSHKDVPDEIQEELYMEEQQRLEKEKRKGLTLPGPELRIHLLRLMCSHPNLLGLT